jgi:glycosyltransferase involved in cell wall biosynthesis
MRALHSAGAEVTIFVPFDTIKNEQIWDHVKYKYLLTDDLSGFSNLKIHQYYANLIKKHLVGYDVVFTCLDNDNDILHYVKAVNSFGGKLVMEMNENPYSIIGSRKDFRFILFCKRWYFLNFVVPKVNGFIVISRNLETLFNRYKNKKSQIIRIPILSANFAIKINKFPKTDHHYILHAGSLSEQKDGVKSMLSAYKIAKSKLNRELSFFFTQNKGLPNLLKWINNFIAFNKLEKNIVFKGILSPNELEKLYADCDLAIINKPYNFQNNFNFSSKIPELIQRQIPLIISKTKEHEYYFRHDYNCYLVEPNDEEAIAKGIGKIITDKKYSEYIAENASKLIESDFYFLNHQKSLFDFFYKVKNS